VEYIAGATQFRINERFDPKRLWANETVFDTGKEISAAKDAASHK
jgi:hypothetical protein